MKMELPCEIVQDLLPGYIDELTSEKSTQAVEGHLKECKACEETYQIMKKNYRKQSLCVEEKEIRNEQEKELFKKINVRIHKKVKATAIAGVVTVIAILFLVHLLFNVAAKEVAIEDVSVEAMVYPIEEIVTRDGKMALEESDSHSIVISKEEIKENDDEVYALEIPDSPQVAIRVTESITQKCEYLTVLSWYSPYILNEIDWEYEDVDGEKIMKVTGFRTTFFKNKAPAGDHITMSMEFDKIDKIVFVEKNGNERILWEQN